MSKTDKTFSVEIEQWLNSKEPKTFESLQTIFGEKSLAIIVLLLMFWPALPLPTGGLTHVFEVIVMLIALEMILGIKKIWLPKKWRNKSLGEKTIKKAIPFIIRRIRWFERFARPRFTGTLGNTIFLRLAGLMIFIFALSAFTSPLFSGLDTLPALGAVVIALSLILGDMAIFIIGCFIGLFGIALSITIGAAIFQIFKHLFESI